MELTLITAVKIEEDLDRDISKERMRHILGRYEGTASEYYNDFQNNDESFSEEPLKYMSKLTGNILGAIDYIKVQEIRNENYKYLEGELFSYNEFTPIFNKGPFSYPLYVNNGYEVRRLLSKKIYISLCYGEMC